MSYSWCSAVPPQPQSTDFTQYNSYGDMCGGGRGESSTLKPRTYEQFSEQYRQNLTQRQRRSRFCTWKNALFGCAYILSGAARWSGTAVLLVGARRQFVAAQTINCESHFLSHVVLQSFRYVSHLLSHMACRLTSHHIPCLPMG